MKFSYSLIKKFLPNLPVKKRVIEELNMKFMETTDLGGDTFEVNLLPNRYGDAASHWGLAKEIAAIFNLSLPVLPPLNKVTLLKKNFSNFQVKVLDKKLCPRYMVQYFENISIKPSPAWLKNILITCGLKPINNVVDIMNYAMLEIGQPLHAFDYDKCDANIRPVRQAQGRPEQVEGRIHTNDTNNKKQIIIRKAKKGEKIITLDDETYELDKDILVIADSDSPRQSASGPRESAILAIAGIKGGKKAEIDKKTRRIIVESANFEAISIYKTVKKIKLQTDASLRFSHNLHPVLAEIGLKRAAYLLNKIVGASAGSGFDSNKPPHQFWCEGKIKPTSQVVKLDIKKFNRLIGVKFTLKEIEGYLKRLGFKNLTNGKWEIPFLRSDIKTMEDLAEEVVRLFDVNKIKSSPPKILVKPPETEEMIVLKNQIRRLMISFSLDEVYNYSFISEETREKFSFNKETIELENPISREFYCLRSSLSTGLLDNLRYNSRFFDEIKIFEIGRIFYSDAGKILEKEILGAALAAKNKSVFFELKGIIEEILKSFGIFDYFITESKNLIQSKALLKIEVKGLVLGYLVAPKNKLKDFEAAILEIELDNLLKLARNKEIKHGFISKFPSITRDISLSVDRRVKIGGIMEFIQNINKKLINKVELIDEYANKNWSGKQGLTFRIIFQEPNRTLLNKEADDLINKITSSLREKFKAEIR